MGARFIIEGKRIDNAQVRALTEEEYTRVQKIYPDEPLLGWPTVGEALRDWDRAQVDTLNTRTQFLREALGLEGDLPPELGHLRKREPLMAVDFGLDDAGHAVVPKTYEGTFKEKPLRRQMFRLKDAGARSFQLEHGLSAWCPLIQVMDIGSNEVVSFRARVIRQGVVEVSFDRPVTAPEEANKGVSWGFSVTLIG